MDRHDLHCNISDAGCLRYVTRLKSDKLMPQPQILRAPYDNFISGETVQFLLFLDIV